VNKYNNPAFDEHNYASIDDNYEVVAPHEPAHVYSSMSEKTQWRTNEVTRREGFFANNHRSVSTVDK